MRPKEPQLPQAVSQTAKTDFVTPDFTIPDFEDDSAVYITDGHALPVDVDDESSIVDNSDGLNVLSDPRKPPPAGARKPPAQTTPSSTAPKPGGGPVVYPLSSSTELMPCAACVPFPEPYCVSATDIPLNGTFVARSAFYVLTLRTINVRSDSEKCFILASKKLISK